MRGPQLFWLVFGFVSRVIKYDYIHHKKYFSEWWTVERTLQQGSLGMNVSAPCNCVTVPIMEPL